ncbi:Probable purine permease 10 [Linum grandiflorum]
MTTQPPEIQLQVLVGDDIKDPPAANHNTAKRNYWWWTKVTIYTILVLLGQSVGLLLGRLYFLKGGTSKWISSVVQVAGFPVLIPYYLLVLSTSVKQKTKQDEPAAASPLTLVSIYAGLGLILGFSTFLYSVGLQYVPVSTYTLLCSSQLAFNSFFAYFLNSQKFTPYVVNSLVLLTVSSLLLVFNTEDDEGGNGGEGPAIPRIKYTTGFLCTLAASAIYGLILSLTELTFAKVIKRRTFKHVMDMNICLNLAATSVTLVGLFASGEWKGLGGEMKTYDAGTASYVMTLVGIAVFWQLFYIGIIGLMVVGLIFEVSSLFSNSISVVGAPIVPIMAVVFFHDKMSGVKGVSMALAIWGFVSYVFPYYVDDRKSKAATAAGGSSRRSVDVHDERN